MPLHYQKGRCHFFSVWITNRCASPHGSRMLISSKHLLQTSILHCEPWHNASSNLFLFLHIHARAWKDSLKVSQDHLIASYWHDFITVMSTFWFHAWCVFGLKKPTNVICTHRFEVTILRASIHWRWLSQRIWLHCPCILIEPTTRLWCNNLKKQPPWSGIIVHLWYIFFTYSMSPFPSFCFYPKEFLISIHCMSEQELNRNWPAS